MKVWIDKQGGTHYHKEDCPMIKGETVSLRGEAITKLPPIKFHYEEINHIIRHRRGFFHKELAAILIENKIYYPCPMCFGDKRK